MTVIVIKGLAARCQAQRPGGGRCDRRAFSSIPVRGSTPEWRCREHTVFALPAPTPVRLELRWTLDDGEMVGVWVSTQIDSECVAVAREARHLLVA